MSWGFGGLASAVSDTETQANAGTDLESIETEKLGFQALSGDRRLRLLPQPWPTDALPSKTASLLAVASARKLLVAGAPESLVVYETDAIRAAFARDGTRNIDDLAPKAQIAVPRLSHLAFSNDERALVVSAESGGGLAVYDASNIGPGLSPGIQIATNGVGVRHLLPNPGKDFSDLFAMVLENGHLCMANLKTQELMKSVGGTNTFRDNVSCASWSKLGKQLVVGLADGSAVQLDMQGNQKDHIPRPPNLPGDYHVNAIYWLENLDFLLIHTAATMPEDPMDMDGVYHIVHRDKDTKACSFHRFSVPPCTVLEDQLPAHFFMQRIRDWQPNLDDTIIIASSASTDIGLLTRSKVPLTADLPAEQVVHSYTTTAVPDTRRAALPIASDGVTDTFPIGVALDMGSQQKVVKPVPNDETLEASTTPLPQYCVLNQEGYLSAWWYIYNEAVQQGIAAPSIATSGEQLNTPQSVVQAGPIETNLGQSKPASGQTSIPPTAFGQTKQTPSAFGQPTISVSSFGQPSALSAFGQASKPASSSEQPNTSTSAFGQPSALGFGKPSFGGATAMGQGGSPWSSKPPAAGSGGSFGQPSFGAASQIGASAGLSAFGQIGGMGTNKASPWGSSTTNTASPFAAKSPFAASSSQASPFAAVAKSDTKDATNSSPFAGFASKQGEKSPFASFSSQNNSSSPFAANKPALPNETSFGSTVTLDSKVTSSFGSGSTFGTAPFGKSQQEETMSDATPKEEKTQSSALNSLSGFRLGTTFKPDDAAKHDLPISQDVSKSLFGSTFGAALGAAAKEKATPAIKDEPDNSQPSMQSYPAFASAQKPVTMPKPAAGDDSASKAARAVSFQDDAPLPPDFTSKPSKASVEDAPLPPDFTKQPLSQGVEDAPLPPDFTTSSKKAHEENDAPLPPDFMPAKSTSALTQKTIPLPAEDTDESNLEDDAESGQEDDLDASDLPEDDEDEDWDDEDDIEDENEDEDSRVIVNPSRLSAFEARLAPASPTKSESEDQSTTPETIHKPSFTPAGFPKAPLNFVPTRKVEESPRSPSPVRAVTSPVRFDNARSSAKQAPVAQTPLNSADRTASLRQQKQPPTAEELEDAEEERRRQIAAAPIDPSTTLPEFVAHQDYTGMSKEAGSAGLAGQLERVFRDINSMIDTLGLNARALQSFVAGHERARSKELGPSDFADEDGWVLMEIPALEDLEAKLSKDLDAGKLTNIGEKIGEIIEQDEQLLRMRTRTSEIRRQLSSRTDADKKALQQAQPLPPDWATQQLELRKSLQEVQKLMSQVEDSVGVLRADIASASATSSHITTAVPTVEAVTKTIVKMTAMIEKKSGDVDMLEAQIRRLPGGARSLTTSNHDGNDLAESLAASRISNGSYSTPRKLARSTGNGLGMSAMLGPRFGTPSSARTSVMFDPSASLLARSTASFGGSARKKMSDVTAEEVEAWKSKVDQRRRAVSALRQAVHASSDRTVRFGTILYQ